MKRKRFRNALVLLLALLTVLLSSCIIKGETGEQGPVGEPGADGKDGTDGVNGADGKSAYELALEDGFEGSLHEWLLSLAVRGAAGENGADGEDGADGRGVEEAYVDEDGNLIVRLTDGTELNAGYVGGGEGFSDRPDAQGFYEVYETVVMNDNHSTIHLREEPDLDSASIGFISTGDEILRIGVQRTEGGFSRLLRNDRVYYARSSNFYLKYEATKPEIHLPDRIVMIRGEETRIYTDQIVAGVDESFRVVYSYGGTGDVTFFDERAFSVTPQVLGETVLTVRIKKLHDGVLQTVAEESATVTVVERSDTLSKTGILIGDSRISGGDLLNSLTAAFPNLRLLGTRTTGDSPILHEGRAGWSTTDYVSASQKPNPVAGKPAIANAFYNAALTGAIKFDFSYYMQRNFPTETLDFVVIQLGANGGFSEESAEHIGAMVESIRAYSQATGDDVEIIVLHEYISPAEGYAIDSNYVDIPAKREKQFRFFTYLEELLAGRESEGISLLGAHLSINARSDWPQQSVVTENGTEWLISDPVHLGEQGYKKVATALGAKLLSLFSTP